jgi:hypothetical protein
MYKLKTESMKNLFLILLLSFSGSFCCKVYCQTNATSQQSTTDTKDWILKSGTLYSNPSQVILDGGDGVGGSVKIWAESGTSGNGNIEMQSFGKIIFRYGTSENTSTRVGIGFNTPAEALHINGYVRGNLTGGALRINTANGNLDLGPQSSTCANINTDRNYFLFNKPISSTGSLSLQTDGATRLTVQSDGINGGLTGGALRIRTTYGTLDLGPQSSTCAHINTDRNYFLFNKPISATADFNLQTNGTTRMTIYNANGNIGIGTSSAPTSKLEVIGNICNAGSDFVLGTNDSRPQGTQTANRALVHSYDLNKDELVINYEGDFEDGVRIMGPSVLFYGNVGIGLLPPTGYKFAVDGKIIAEEIMVKMSENWPDYVFSDSYKMRSLEELETFIKKNNRLPDVPSANEVKENGIAIGEMNKILLEKIEETTLYLIELKKQNDQLVKRIEELEKNNSKK